MILWLYKHKPCTKKKKINYISMISVSVYRHVENGGLSQWTPFQYAYVKHEKSSLTLDLKSKSLQHILFSISKVFLCRHIKSFIIYFLYFFERCRTRQTQNGSACSSFHIKIFEMIGLQTNFCKIIRQSPSFI